MSIVLRGLSFVIRLPRRGYRFTRRIIFAEFDKFYVWLVILYVRRRESLSKSFLTKPAFNALVVMDDDIFCKVALNKKSTIGFEYNNFEKIRKNCPALLPVLLDYKIKKNAFVSYLSMTCCRPIGIEDSLVYACVIYKIMRDCGSPEKQFEISESDELLAGLDIISGICGASTSQRIYQFVDSYLKNGKYHVGFAHGDFHSRNILTDDTGTPRLIDLDCVRFHSIQELDALYFVLEMEWSKSGKPWYETIVSYLKGDIPAEASIALNAFSVEYSHGLAVTYLVDRIGQETKNYGLKYTAVQIDPAIRAILSIPFELVLPHIQ